MYGLIFGDASGSYYEKKEGTAFRTGFKVPYEERIEVLDKTTRLLDSNSTITDDSVLAFAVIKKLIEDGNYEGYYRYYGEKEINIGLEKRGIPAFGSMFEKWIKQNRIGETIDSYGNGGSMRVAPIGYYYDDLDIILKEVEESCKPTHNNEEAIKCAQMVGTAVYLARNNCSKKEIKSHLMGNYEYPLDYSLEYLQKNYIFTTRSKNSVPIAIAIFLQSDNFEDAIRKALSVGGDTDTIAAICGAVSESFYGIPKYILEDIKKYIPIYMSETFELFYEQRGLKLEK